MWKLFVALRYIRRRVTTYIAAAGVAIGVMVLVIVLSVMGGFQREFYQQLRGINSHIIVEFSDFGLTDPAPLVEAVKKISGVKAVSPFIENWILYKFGGDVRMGKIRGFDPSLQTQIGRLAKHILRPDEADIVAQYERYRDWKKRYEQVIAERRAQLSHLSGAQKMFAEMELAQLEEDYKRITGYLREKKARYEEIKHRPPLSTDEVAEIFEMRHTTLPGVVVGVELLKATGLRVGDEIQLLTAKVLRMSAVRSRRFVILSAFKTGLYKVDSAYCYALTAEAKDFIGADGISGLLVSLKDYRNARQVKQAIRKAVRDVAAEHDIVASETTRFSVRTWDELDKTLMRAVRMEKWLLGFIIFFIVVVAGFGIVALLTMMVTEKTRDIGILKALGATMGGVMGVFVAAGVTIAVAGSLIGVVCGLLFVYNINEVADLVEKVTGYHPFPPDVYYLEKIPVLVDAGELVSVILPTLFLSFLFALYPAVKAARLEAVEALRYE